MAATELCCWLPDAMMLGCAGELVGLPSGEAPAGAVDLLDEVTCPWLAVLVGTADVSTKSIVGDTM